MHLGMQAEGTDKSVSMWLTGTIDTVSANDDCAASLLGVARLGQARSPSGSHFSSSAATHVTGERNFCKA